MSELLAQFEVDEAVERLYRAGEAAERAGHLREAAVCFRVAADQHLGDAAVRLAVVLFALGEISEAQHWCEVAVADGFDAATTRPPRSIHRRHRPKATDIRPTAAITASTETNLARAQPAAMPATGIISRRAARAVSRLAIGCDSVTGGARCASAGCGSTGASLAGGPLIESGAGVSPAGMVSMSRSYGRRRLWMSHQAKAAKISTAKVHSASTPVLKWVPNAATRERGLAWT